MKEIVKVVHQIMYGFYYLTPPPFLPTSVIIDLQEIFLTPIIPIPCSSIWCSTTFDSNISFHNSPLYWYHGVKCYDYSHHIATFIDGSNHNILYHFQFNFLLRPIQFNSIIQFSMEFNMCYFLLYAGYDGWQ